MYMSERLHRPLQTQLRGKSQLLIDNKFIRVRADPVRFPSGAEGTYYWVDDEYPAAATVAVDKQCGVRKTFLVLQERYPSQTIGWEVPAGSTEPGEEPWEAAARELKQEGGLVAEHWQLLPQQTENVGRGNSRSDVLLAAGITAAGAAIDPNEVIVDAGWFTSDQIEDMALGGQINAGHTMASLFVANAFMRHHPDHIISQMVG